jgi:4'-phosphopantetheinyl transferase
MPLLKLQTNHQSGWGLWFVMEAEQEFREIISEPVENEIIHPHKRLEWLAARALMKALTQEIGIHYKGIIKDEFGKPHLANAVHHISLSHSYPYVAAQINHSQAVGIDLEKPRPKLLRIAHRILSREEHFDAGENIVKHCVYWCAKEAMYKSHGKRGLHFSSQLLVKPFSLQNSGELQGSIITNDHQQSLTLQYQIQPDYVMVYTKTHSI